MARAFKSPHIGGTQEPLFKPHSDWVPPASLPDLRHHRVVALDLETRDDGLAAGRGPAWPQRAGHVCGVAAAWPRGNNVVEAAYFPVQHQDTACFPPDMISKWVTEHAAAGVRFLFHNAHYDLGWLRAGFELKPTQAHDTQCAAVMLDENKLSYALDALCREEGLPGKDEGGLREALTTYGYPARGDGWKSALWRLPARYVGPYAEADVRATLALWEKYAPRLEAEGVLPAYETEMALVPCVHEMRWRGIRVDCERAARVAETFREQRDAALAELSRRIGRRVSIDDVNRNRWLAEVFDEAGIQYPRTPPSSMFPNGQPSFSASRGGWMGKHPHWLPQLVVRAERKHKAAKDFLESFILGFAHRGRLHASINQYRGEDGGTRTQRFSYADPPLQQMPTRTEEGAQIRGCFQAEEGERWVKTDARQQEYRLIVHFAEMLKFPSAREAGDRYRADPDTDFHDMMTEIINPEVNFAGMKKDLYKTYRDPAKDCNFANAYGASVPKFAEMTNRPLAEAKAIMDQVNGGAPFVRELMGAAASLASRRGYIRLLDGARLHYERWEPTWRNWEAERGKDGVAPCSLEEARRRIADETHPWHGRKLKRAMTHKAGNALIQGSAARHMKLTMVGCWSEGIVPLLQMHDELDFSAASESAARRVGEIMCESVRLTVPMMADTGVGSSWGDAKHRWEDVT